MLELEETNKSRWLFYLFAFIAIITNTSVTHSQSGPVDCSSYVTVTTANDRSTLDPRTRMITSTADVTITNKTASGKTLSAPLLAVISINNANGTVTMPEALGGPGTQPYGKYYYDLSSKLTNRQLLPGAKFTFGVKFVRSSTVQFTYTVSTFAVLPSANQPPVANAGPPQTITLPATATLNGTATDDGLPTGSTLTVTWSKVSGPGTVTFGNKNALSTTASFSQSGTYVLRLTASDSQLSSSSDETITVNPANQPPVVNAGSPQTITLPATATLNGTATDDGLPTGSTLTVTWSKVSGPGTVTFGNKNALSTTASFSQSGTYVLRLTASDSQLSSSSDETITVNPANQPPVVNAGSPQTITLPATATLNGTATDDGLPTGSTLTVTWSKVSGPGTVTFGNKNTLSTTASFSQAGTYVLRLTASDSQLSSSNNVTITVNPANQPPVANAGTNRTVTIPYGQTNVKVTLDGSASTDPDGTIASYTWSGTPKPDNVIKPTVTLAEGAFTFSLVVTDNNGAASASKNVVITVVKEVVHPPQLSISPPPYQAVAGSTTPLSVTVSTNSPDGRAVVLSASPQLSNATFSTSGGTTATGNLSFKPDFNQTGIYLLTFTARDAYGITSSSTIQINVSTTNRPPILTVQDTATVAEGAVLKIPVTATDPDGDIVTLTATGLPTNAVFVPASGAITFSPATGQARPAPYVVTVTGSDGQLNASKQVSITVTSGSGGGQGALTLTVDPVESPSFLTTQRITGSVNSAGQPQPTQKSALITGMNPTTGKQGETLNVNLTGDVSNYVTHFVSGSSVASFGTGITVKSLSVSGPTQATAMITIDPTAVAGPRSVSVTTGTETSVSINAFNVLKGTTSITGKLVDPTSGQAIAGAKVVIQGTNLTATTDANGYYTLQGVPAGQQTVIVNADNRELVTVVVNAQANTSLTLDDIKPNLTVFDPASSPSATLLSVIGRGIAAMAPTGKSNEDLKKTVVDAIVMTGGKSCGVLDEFGNQLNTNIIGNGTVSLTSRGGDVLIERWRNGELMNLGTFFRGFTAMFDWPEIPYQIETIQQLQAVVDKAWADPQDPSSALMIAIFNHGTSISPISPKLRPETMLNALQTYLLTSTAFAWATKELVYQDLNPQGPGTGTTGIGLRRPNREVLLAYNGLDDSDVVVSDAKSPILLADNSNKPVANAGLDQTITIDEETTKVDVTLHGSGYDPSGGTVGFYWYKTSSNDPDPVQGEQDVTVSLTSGGLHTFRLYVMNNVSGAVSDPSDVNIIITGNCAFSSNFDTATASWCNVFTNAIKDSTLKIAAKPVEDYLSNLTETLKPVLFQKPDAEKLVKDGWVNFFEKANSQNVNTMRDMAETQGMKNLYKEMQTEAAAMNKSVEFINTSATIVKESLKSIVGAMSDMILDPLMQKFIDGIIEYSRPATPFIQKVELVNPDSSQEVSQYVKITFQPSLSELNDTSSQLNGTLDGIRNYAYLIFRNNDRIDIVKSSNLSKDSNFIELNNNFGYDSHGNYVYIDRHPNPGTNSYQLATRLIRSKTVPLNPYLPLEQKILLDVMIDKVPGSDFTSRFFWKSLDAVEQVLMGLIKQDSDLSDPKMVYVGAVTQNLHPTLELAVDKNAAPNVNYLSIPDSAGIFKILPAGISLYAFANFKQPAGLAIDRAGNLYAESSTSDDQFGGRIFRFTPYNTRELAGTVNYYSPDLQYARPTSVRTLAYGIDGQGEGLYIADSVEQVIKRLDISGGKTADLWNRNVGQLYATSNAPDNFFFQDTTKMLSDVRSVLFITQGPDLFRVDKTVAGSTLVRKVFPSDKNPFDWLSGIDVDPLGNYYLADFSRGDVTMIPRSIMDSGMFMDLPESTRKRYLIMTGLSSPVDLKVTDGGRGLIVVDGIGLHNQGFGISGRIWDSQNGTYLAGADIIVGDGLKFAKTDADGFFMIPGVSAPLDPVGIKLTVMAIDGRMQVFPNIWLANYGHTPLLEDLSFNPPPPPQPQPPGPGVVKIDPDPFPVQTDETVTSDTPGQTQMRNFVVPDRRIYLDTDPNAPPQPPPALIKTGLDFVPSPGEKPTPGPSGPTVIRPTVSIISPADKLITGEGSIPIIGMVVPSENISQVTLTINGQDRQINVMDGIFSDVVNLRAGINAITARAGTTFLDTSSNTYFQEGMSEPVVVTRDVTAQPSLDYAGVIVLSGSNNTLTAAADMKVSLYAQINGTNTVIASTYTKSDGTYKIHLDNRGQPSDNVKWLFDQLSKGNPINISIITNNYASE